MGFFTKDSTPSPDGADGLAPLSKDRIKHGLEAQGWSYSVDSDGDIGGGWEYASFCFMLNGKEDELLCIRGSWRGQLVADEFANIAMIAATGTPNGLGLRHTPALTTRVRFACTPSTTSTSSR